VESLRLPAHAQSIPALRGFALEAAGKAGLDAGQVQRVDLVLEEALANIINHAYPENTPDPLVELGAGTDTDGVFLLALTDHGPPFDPVGVSEAAPELEASLAANMEADLEHRLPGGLGLFLIQSMSEASYRREDGANILTLRFPPEQP
jgi:serine/threonine-protein kinase RsbW